MKYSNVVRASVFGLVSAFPIAGAAQSTESLFGKQTLSVTYGPYARIELGAASPSLGDGSWLPPGSSDPQITFDVMPDKTRTAFGAIALGYDWQNGFRGDVALFGTGSNDVTAPCVSASNGTSCATHADITGGSIQTQGLMANVFYAPLEAQGSNALFQPFVVAGLGVAKNTVGDWTRTKNSGNATVESNPVRTYQGDTSNDFAWSLGFGASYQVTRPGKWPVLVEASWRYYDFGQASGSAEPLGESGMAPREAFSFDNTNQVLSIGVRIPLKRY
jgi:opacity protein-like surface antigen